MVESSSSDEYVEEEETDVEGENEEQAEEDGDENVRNDDDNDSDEDEDEDDENDENEDDTDSEDRANVDDESIINDDSNSNNPQFVGFDEVRGASYSVIDVDKRSKNGMGEDRFNQITASPSDDSSSSFVSNQRKQIIVNEDTNSNDYVQEVS